MSHLEELRTRPEFESIELDVGVEEAQRLVSEAMRGLTTAETEEGTRYRTTDGMLVAIVGPGVEADGEDTASLACRTVPASDHATRKAAKILDALEPYLVDH